MKPLPIALTLALTLATTLPPAIADDRPGPPWSLGKPIVTYWAGPGYGGTPLTDDAAKILADGGWNVVWCRENELDVAHRHGLRAQLGDPLLSPASLDDPARRASLAALIARVRRHPALYSYFLTDEPSASRFRDLGRLVARLRELDPAHIAYINLFPTYANNEQLGTTGDTITAYRAYLRTFTETVRPSLLSYDHYQFAKGKDMNDYFLNLALVRRQALDSGLPILNIVQACTWTPAMREPSENEMRYLVYTSLAYGAQGISYYVYSHPGHTPGIVAADGQPTPVYHWLKPLNRDFAAIAEQLQPSRSRGVFHAGMLPPGAESIPADASFTLDPPVANVPFEPGRPVRGVLLGTFGTPGGPESSLVVVVNLDYQAPRTVTLRGPARLDRFDPVTRRWSRTQGTQATLDLPPGGGQLLRVGVAP